MKNLEFYAHSLTGKPMQEWQTLDQHLKNVSEKARQFSEFFNAGDWAYIAGLWHDLGKGSREFQAYLRKSNNVVDAFEAFYQGKVDHASYGAQHAFNLSNNPGKLLAYLIAGHHTGLLNWTRDEAHGLKYRLDKEVYSVCFDSPPAGMPSDLPFKKDKDRFGFQLQFFLRMVFSCLVDADFLDTEEFMTSSQRESFCITQEMHDRFWNNFNALRVEARKTAINDIREKILNDCLVSADKSPGIFSLTVPTGGGKTLASMAFALKHALKFNKRRVIYVIPFTSIIEQNAQVFRDMLGDEAVLEHHCNFVPDDADRITKLRTENWDAPVIVTTNVQFFNSFFANKTSKCRKLHNIAESVVILDEVQAIPVEKLQPCLEVIRELSMNYGVSSVLCSATQPAINKSDDFKSGLTDVREIISDVACVFKGLKRTEVVHIGKQDSKGVAERMVSQDQVLCIVNTRKQAKNIYSLIGDQEGHFHLSALMCPAHRSQVLSQIRNKLNAGERCRVISTQLVEAGVDVDFPVVIRSIGGMDSIAQAAGRCNREGLRSKGEVFVFEPEEGVPAGYFRQTAQCAERLFDKFSGSLLEPECMREYFLNYYWLNQDRMDDDHVLENCKAGSRGNIQFEELAEFKMIKTATQPVIILFDKKAEQLTEQLKYSEHPSGILRQLQRYAVQVYPYHLKQLDGCLESVNQVPVLRVASFYDSKTGLVSEIPEYLNPNDTII